jgi:hypothetical protein
VFTARYGLHICVKLSLINVCKVLKSQAARILYTKSEPAFEGASYVGLDLT